MMQLYFLSILYLLVSSGLLLLNSYRQRLSFLLRFRNTLRENEILRDLCFAAGLLLSVLMFFFPCAPGPRFLGDFLPSFAILVLAFYFRILYSERFKDTSDLYISSRRSWRSRTAGIAVLILAVLHFILPFFVLL